MKEVSFSRLGALSLECHLSISGQRLAKSLVRLGPTVVGGEGVWARVYAGTSAKPANQTWVIDGPPADAGPLPRTYSRNGRNNADAPGLIGTGSCQGGLGEPRTR